MTCRSLLEYCDSLSVEDMQFNVALGYLPPDGAVSADAACRQSGLWTQCCRCHGDRELAYLAVPSTHSTAMLTRYRLEKFSS
jgi:hypothetical protein